MAQRKRQWKKDLDDICIPLKATTQLLAAYAGKNNRSMFRTEAVKHLPYVQRELEVLAIDLKHAAESMYLQVKPVRRQFNKVSILLENEAELLRILIEDRIRPITDETPQSELQDITMKLTNLHLELKRAVFAPPLGIEKPKVTPPPPSTDSIVNKGQRDPFDPSNIPE